MPVMGIDLEKPSLVLGFFIEHWRQKMNEELNEELKDFEQLIYKKITNGNELSNVELREVVNCFRVEESLLKTGLQNEYMRTIVSIYHKYYAIDWRYNFWDLINTYGQPYEVVKTIKTVTDWKSL